ncbi:hypothetical protein [Aquimarina sp. Aq107]|uniref:hypothetical protein n=1 Tax=Aquimarina sp. Aq107 TaxID=1191912 RepID=UPI000D560C18|nr:hypothetical protein [Aquimarina sp. Aq107]
MTILIYKIINIINLLFKPTVLIVLILTVISCEEEAISDTDITNIVEDNDLNDLSKASSDTPWDFDSSYSSNDDFQVDNDGGGAHNWNEREYQDDPNDNGFDITDYIYVDGSRLILQCPNGNERRRAEYRDQTNIDMDRRNRLDLTFDVRGYDNRHELILAQLHNDHRDARRPYATVVAENGIVRLKRTNAPTGSSTTTAAETIPFRQNDRYRIRMETPNGSRNLDVRIDNLDTGERARNTFSFDSDWSRLDGNFYWKHGAYMPDGGSNNTRQRVETISFATNRT